MIPLSSYNNKSDNELDLKLNFELGNDNGDKENATLPPHVQMLNSELDLDVVNEGNEEENATGPAAALAFFSVCVLLVLATLDYLYAVRRSQATVF